MSNGTKELSGGVPEMTSYGKLLHSKRWARKRKYVDARYAEGAKILGREVLPADADDFIVVLELFDGVRVHLAPDDSVIQYEEPAPPAPSELTMEDLEPEDYERAALALRRRFSVAGDRDKAVADCFLAKARDLKSREPGGDL